MSGLGRCRGVKDHCIPNMEWLVANVEDHSYPIYCTRWQCTGVLQAWPWQMCVWLRCSIEFAVCTYRTYASVLLKERRREIEKEEWREREWEREWERGFTTQLGSVDCYFEWHSPFTFHATWAWQPSAHATASNLVLWTFHGFLTQWSYHHVVH